MTVWIEGTATVLTAVKATYAALGVKDGETINTVVWNADNTRWFTGSNRITNGQADQLGASHNPNLTIHTDPSFMDAWDYPVMDGE
tara:strand:- start:37 stop:294 length:258 start_codon:yes stop_codon:yes gene_type:complete